MKHRLSPWVVLAAAGTALTAASFAQAQQLVNLAGSSLLSNFITAQASTNDFIGVSAQNPPIGTDLISATSTWSVNYRVSGSINGLSELINWGAPFFYQGIDNRIPNNSTPFNSYVLTDEWYNRAHYINSGTPSVPLGYTATNPGGLPMVANTGGADRSIIAGPVGANGGATVDVAYTDVPAIWGIQQTGTSSPNAQPTNPGYGINPKVSVGKDGSLNGGGFTNSLGTLGSRNLVDDPNRGAAPYDANTIFTYPLTLAVIAPVTNPGTGIVQMKMTEEQYLWATGRAKTGENFVVLTRDVGSGTRNGAMNAIGLDPSHGIGDNIGLQSTLSNANLLGPDYQPTNKGSTGAMLSTLRNTRLGVGYAGAETGVSGASPSSWLSTNALEIIDTLNDLPAYGGTAYVRPTLVNVLDNTGANGWVINGEAHLNSIGDPQAEPAGINTAAVPNNGGAANGNPAMVNKSAARYMNNIIQSISAFNAVNPPASTVASPGEFLATNFVLLNAVTHSTPVGNSLARVVNPNYNANANAFTQSFNTTFTNARYAAHSSISGYAPTRETGHVYSDNVANGANYIAQSGAAVAYASALSVRNTIAFDFNGDGVRSLADANDMILAFNSRNGGPAWNAPDGIYGAGAGQNAVIEILGDADGDGSFTKADIRYWADGLALGASGNIDRNAGFTAVDNASLAAGGALNFFGTTKATGTPYAAGDSRADIIGPSGNVAPGWAPVGSDGVIDQYDIMYVQAQFHDHTQPTPYPVVSANWASIAQAEKFDLSADMNGDLVVNQADVDVVVKTVLGTCYGDLALKGHVTLQDRATVIANVGTLPATWARGDLNGDGVIDSNDTKLVCPADVNCDGHVTVQDIFDFLTDWFAHNIKADINGSGSITVQDIFDFLGAWFQGQCN